jgi:hypothetical protein
VYHQHQLVSDTADSITGPNKKDELIETMLYTAAITETSCTLAIKRTHCLECVCVAAATAYVLTASELLLL